MLVEFELENHENALHICNRLYLLESDSIESDSDAVLFIHCQNSVVNQDGRLLCQIVVSKNLVDMADKMAEAKAKLKSGRSA